MEIINDIEKKRITFRRLLLAKQLYFHGLDHANKVGALNKMIAVHNFHNSLEIALRSIILHYEIRSEKQLNIEFETMLKEIDNYQFFKDKGIKLPYRQELRNLNQIRNLIQHHVFEPEFSAIEEWKVFSRRFLIRAYDEYFQVDFNSISAVEMVDDEYLKHILRLSEKGIKENKYEESIIFSKVAFKWAEQSIFSFVPEEKNKVRYSIHSKLEKVNGLQEVLEKLEEQSQDSKYFAILLSSGVNFVDYKKFCDLTPIVNFAMSGKFEAVWTGRETESNEENSKWVYDFVINCILNWQQLGLNPTLPENAIEKTKEIIAKGFDIFK